MKLSDEDAERITSLLDDWCWSCTDYERQSKPPTMKDENDPTKCGLCGGSKHITTTAGDNLLGFLRRHLPELLKER